MVPPPAEKPVYPPSAYRGGQGARPFLRAEIASPQERRQGMYEGSSANLPLDSVLPRPLPRRRLIPGPVGFVEMRNFRNQRIIGIRIREHRANR